MIDPFSDIALLNNTQSLTANRYLPHSQNQKLPRIQKQKQTTISKLIAKNFIKSSTKLPNVKVQNTTIINEQKINHLQNFTHGVHQRIKTRQKSQGDDFATQIQKKLKIVLEGQSTNNNYVEASDSDEDFQNKINKHREIIRKQRIRREVANQSAQLSQQNIINLFPENDKKRQSSISNHPQHQKITAGNQKNKSKHDSIYEKRIKDYREQSIGNKFLIKKKQIIQKQHLLPLRKIQQTQEQTVSIHFQSLKNKNGDSNALSKKKLSKNDMNLIRDEQLFQNIHNILLNPVRKSEFDIGKQKPKKNKENLQQKLKQIQKKLTGQRKQDLQLLQRLEKVNKKQINPFESKTEATLSSLTKEQHPSWRKIDVSNTQLQTKKTNFQDEVERVNKYFQKSERSLQKYIQNQRKLVGLNLIKKIKQEMAKVKA